MKIEPVRPIPQPSFGILEHWHKTLYGDYMKGTYKGNHYEVYNAYKYDQKLIYVSDSVSRWVKSKLTYIRDGVRHVMRASAK